MSGTFDHYQRYNDLVEFITQKSAAEYPAAKLILHVMEQQYEKSGLIAFTGDRFFPEADGYNQTINDKRERKGANSVSNYWIDALNEFANAPTDAGIIDFNKMKAAYQKVTQREFAQNLVDSMYTFRSGRATSAPIDFAKALNKSDVTVNPKIGTDIADRLKLNEIYQDSATGDKNAIDGTKSNRTGQKYNGTGLALPFLVDKVILSLLLEGAFKQTNQATSVPTSNNFFQGTSTGSVPEDKDIIFYRKLGDPNALFRKENGVEIRVEKGSPEFMKLKDDGNCYNTGYTGTKTGETCAELVTQCLKGQEISKCKAFMLSTNWNESLANEKISPEIAVDLLRKFGFNTKNVQVNEIGRNLEMIQEYDEWIADLKKNYVGNGLDDKDVDAISNNTPLTGYLRKLIGLVNSNPGILNRDYTGKANLNQNPAAFANTQLGRFGLLPKQVVAASGVPTMSSVLSLQNAVMANRNQVGINFGIMPQGIIFQRGGGMSSGIAEVLENAQNNSTFPLKLSKLMEDSFNSFVTALRLHKKELDSGDYQHIQKLIVDLRNSEDKLFKAAIYTDKYVRLIGALGQSDTKGVVSLDHAKQFVDRRNSYFNKVGKKQDDLFSILKALAEAQQQETTEETKSVTDYPRF